MTGNTIFTRPPGQPGICMTAKPQQIPVPGTHAAIRSLRNFAICPPRHRSSQLRTHHFRLSERIAIFYRSLYPDQKKGSLWNISSLVRRSALLLGDSTKKKLSSHIDHYLGFRGQNAWRSGTTGRLMEFREVIKSCPCRWVSQTCPK